MLKIDRNGGFFLIRKFSRLFSRDEERGPAVRLRIGGSFFPYEYFLLQTCRKYILLSNLFPVRITGDTDYVPWVNTCPSEITVACFFRADSSVFSAFGRLPSLYEKDNDLKKESVCLLSGKTCGFLGASFSIFYKKPEKIPVPMLSAGYGF